MNMRKRIFAIFAALLPGVVLLAQAPDSLSAAVPDPSAGRTLPAVLAEADSLVREYSFEEAASLYEAALRMAPDSLSRQQIEDALLQAQNGRNMLDYGSRPSVVARQRLSVKDFFLYYPVADGSWRPVPNQLDTLAGNPLVHGMYIPDGIRELYYSSADADGIHNIYRTELRDTVWTVPELINENLTSSSDEIFPVLSPDGNSLYFASKGLYGMGGYDLYVSRWNRESHDWETPVNLGFPYSSPADDFLFMNTPDGKYSLFASNRECSRDSVWVYVLEYDSMPVRQALTDAAQAKALSRLIPDGDPTRLENRGAVSRVQEDDDTRRYTEKMRQVRSLRDTVYAYGRTLDAARGRIDAATEEERATLAAEILRREAELAGLQDSLAAATAQLQKIEMDFLLSGVVLDPDKLQAEADREVVGAASGYAFSRKRMGDPVRMDILRPKPTFDYSFMILPEGRFAEDNTLPDGLVYQIQLFVMSTKATVAQIKGLSPVFCRTGAQQKYTYSVGVFRTYKDVLANLNRVKKQGFRSAFIVAFQDGKSIPVSQARELEKTIRTQYRIRILPPDGDSLSDSAILTIRALTPKDLSKETDGGSVSYVLGPFDDRTEVDRIVAALRADGLSGVSIF